jgi:hypothetical protein
MKKLVLGALVCLVFFACETRYYSVIITNDSSKDIFYEYNGSFDTLAQKNSKTYQVKAYTQSPRDISVTGAMSIKMETRSSGEEYVFTDVTALNLYVLNSLNVKITLLSDNYIDNNGVTSLTIQPKTEIKTAEIYTRAPKFTVLSENSPNIEWNIKNDIMYVTIK